MRAFQEIVDDIVHQLDWRGPSGRAMGYVTIPREAAAELVKGICELQLRPKIDEEETSS